MFAALSMADADLATRALDRSFGFSAGAGADGDGDVDVEGAEAREAMRGKILGTVQGCREMLEKEPPERMEEYWGTVSTTTSFPPICLSPSCFFSGLRSV